MKGGSSTSSRNREPTLLYSRLWHMEFGLKRRRTTSLLNKVGEIVLTDKEYARNVTCYRFLMEQVLLAPKTGQSKAIFSRRFALLIASARHCNFKGIGNCSRFGIRKWKYVCRLSYRLLKRKFCIPRWWFRQDHSHSSSLKSANPLKC